MHQSSQQILDHGKSIERDYTTDEREAIERGAAIVGAGLVPARANSQ
jgi:hypothetical protein